MKKLQDLNIDVRYTTFVFMKSIAYTKHDHLKFWADKLQLLRLIVNAMACVNVSEKVIKILGAKIWYILTFLIVADTYHFFLHHFRCFFQIFWLESFW